MNLRIHTPFYIFFLNPDHIAACSLRSLCSKKKMLKKFHKKLMKTANELNPDFIITTANLLFYIKHNLFFIFFPAINPLVKSHVFWLFFTCHSYKLLSLQHDIV